MIIAISQRHDQNKYGGWIDRLENEYVYYLAQMGVTAIPIPNNPQLVNYYFSKLPITGIILSGGNDICPSSYGENINWPGSSPQRDLTEKRMLELAVERKLPVLGICRGVQFLNVFFGGKLVRDINQEKPIHQTRENHPIRILGGSVKKELGMQAMVNSFHNQAITAETLAPLLRAFALSEKDGIIEGIYYPNLPIAGIQWHPERESPDKEFNQKVIQAFVNRKLFWEKRFNP